MIIDIQGLSKRFVPVAIKHRLSHRFGDNYLVWPFGRRLVTPNNVAWGKILTSNQLDAKGIDALLVNHINRNPSTIDIITGFVLQTHRPTATTERDRIDLRGGNDTWCLTNTL